MQDGQVKGQPLKKITPDPPAPEMMPSSPKEYQSLTLVVYHHHTGGEAP